MIDGEVNLALTPLGPLTGDLTGDGIDLALQITHPRLAGPALDDRQ